MRFSKVTNQIKKYLIKYSQLLGREKYIKFLCYCYRDRITCTGNRLPRYISSDVEFDPSASISLGGVSLLRREPLYLLMTTRLIMVLLLLQNKILIMKRNIAKELVLEMILL